MIYQDEDVPNSSLLYEKATTERNGVTVTVPIKALDINEFRLKIREQLAYFDGVYFDNCGVDNNFKIYRNKDYQISEINANKYLHFTLDDVYYPLDFNKLGVKPIEIPVALRFSLTDGIVMIPNRENIEYTRETKAIILKKIRILITDLVEKYNQKITNFVEIEDLLDFHSNNREGYYTLLTPNQYNNTPGLILVHKSIYLIEYEHYSDVKMVKQIFYNKCPSIPSHYIYKAYQHNFISYEYRISDAILGGKQKRKNIYVSLDKVMVFDKNNKRYTTILYDTPINPKKKRYIKSLYSNDTLFISKVYKPHLFPNTTKDGSDLYSTLHLKDFHKSKWRSIIKEWMTLKQKIVASAVIHEKDIIIPKTWLDAQKKVVDRYKKLEGEVNFKFARESNRGVSSCVFDSKILSLSDKSILKDRIIYSEDDLLLEKFYNLLRPKERKRIKVTLVGKNDFKKLSGIEHHRFIDLNKFMTKYSKQLAKFASQYEAYQFYIKYKGVFELAHEIAGISSQFYKNLLYIENYVEDCYAHKFDGDLMRTILKVCNENNWKDWEAEAVLNSLKQQMPKFDFLPLLTDRSNYRYNSQAKLVTDSIGVVKEILKARKFRMDYINYVTPIVTTVVDEITEEEENDEDEQEIIPEIFDEEVEDSLINTITQNDTITV